MFVCYSRSARDTRTRTHVRIGSIRFRSLTRPVPAQSVSHYVFRGIWIPRGILERCISSGPKLCDVPDEEEQTDVEITRRERDRRGWYRGWMVALIEMRKLSQRQDGRERCYTQRPLTNDVFAIIIRACLLARDCYIFLAFTFTASRSSRLPLDFAWFDREQTSGLRNWVRGVRAIGIVLIL